MDKAEVSDFALSFAGRRLEDALSALAKISPSLSAHVRGASAKGTVPERLRSAADEIQGFASARELPEPALSECRSALGAEYDARTVSALLLAHVSGLRSLATVEGLGAAMLGHYAALFLERLEKRMHRDKLDRESRDAVARSVRFRIRHIMTEFDPDEPDNPLAALAAKKSDIEAAAFVSALVADAPDPNANAATSGLIFSLSGEKPPGWEDSLRRIRPDWKGAEFDTLVKALKALEEADPGNFPDILAMAARLPDAKTAAAYADEHTAMLRASRKKQ
ncbi:MAG TPA: hypothetical protein VLD37_00950 [Candidatus Bilamarchaeum sp.]|nr:hypothetical protein [Candidatus Bilamarchaeum sp.]